MMGEQGAESIHAYFNSLQRTYSTIPNAVERLEYIMKEHFLHVAPANVNARPRGVGRGGQKGQLPPLF